MEDCKQELYNLLLLMKRQPYLKMVDAWGKETSGVFLGNVYSLGSRSACRTIGDAARYCALYNKKAQVFNGTGVPEGNPLHRLIQNQFAAFGLCVPSSCNERTVVSSMNHLMPNATIFSQGSLIKCDGLSNDTATAFSHGTWVMIAMFAIMLSVGIGASLWVAFTSMCPARRWDSADEPLLQGSAGEGSSSTIHFSLYHNLAKIMSLPSKRNPLSCLDGIRTLSLFWIILGHTFAWPLGSALDNVLELARQSSSAAFAILFAGDLAVDTFFVLSGFLTSYLLLKQLQISSTMSVGKLYFHRWVRISPVYYMIVFFYWTIGPQLRPHDVMYSATPVQRQESCSEYWWYHVLYINAFHHDRCVGWSWYLSDDMIYFVLCVPLIILLFRNRKAGALALSSIWLASVVTCIVLSITKHITVPQSNASNKNPFAAFSEESPFYEYLYYEPWSRVQPYILGIGFGIYQLWYAKNTAWLYNSKSKASLWMAVAFALMAVSIFGTYDTPNTTITRTSTVLFLSLSRTAWGASVLIVMLLCMNGQGGAMNAFLSHPAWAPFARVGLSAYLIHPIIMDVFYFSVESTLHYSNMLFTFYAIGFVATSYLFALAITALLESPIRSIMKKTK